MFSTDFFLEIKLVQTVVIFGQSSIDNRGHSWWFDSLLLQIDHKDQQSRFWLVLVQWYKANILSHNTFQRLLSLDSRF